MRFNKCILSIASFITTSSLLIAGCSSQSSNSEIITSKELMANINARKAIAKSIDKQNFVDVILNNGSIATDYFIPEKLSIDENKTDYRNYVGDVGYTHNDDDAINDWENCKEELNFDSVTIDLVTTDTEMNRKLGEYIQSELSILDGLNVSIKQLPYKQFSQSQAKGEFDIILNGWVPDYPDPLTHFGTFLPGQAYEVASGYDNKEYKSLIDQAKTATTIQDSWDIFAKAEKVLLDDAYAIPIYQRSVSYLEKDYVKDIAIATFGPKYSYKWADVTKDSKTLNIVNSADITSLDTAKIRDSLSREVTLNVMEGLVRLDKDLSVVPGVAKEWNVSEDGKTWIFKLREDASWNNGENVTAHDFEYSWKRTLTPSTACENSSMFYDIVGAEDYNMDKNSDMDSVGVKALDDYTLEVNLTRPVTYFDKLLCHPIFVPQNQKFVEEKGSEFGTSIENTLFNGPFVLSSWKLEDQYSMIKNDLYWDKDVVNLNEVHTKVVKDNNSSLNLYESGNIDRVILTSENVDKYRDSNEFGTEIECVTYFLILNGNNHD